MNHRTYDAAEDFALWLAGKQPDMKTLYASYSEDLGTRMNLNLSLTKCPQSIPGRMVLRNAENALAVRDELQQRGVHSVGSRGLITLRQNAGSRIVWTDCVAHPADHSSMSRRLNPRAARW
jgi:hypothetical protein